MIGIPSPDNVFNILAFLITVPIRDLITDNLTAVCQAFLYDMIYVNNRVHSGKKCDALFYLFPRELFRELLLAYWSFS